MIYLLIFMPYVLGCVLAYLASDFANTFNYSIKNIPWYMSSLSWIWLFVCLYHILMLRKAGFRGYETTKKFDE